MMNKFLEIGYFRQGFFGLLLSLILIQPLWSKDFEKVLIKDPKTGKEVEVVKGEFIVKYKEGVGSIRKGALSFNAKVSGVRSFAAGFNADVVKVSQDKYEETLKYYSSQSEVEYVEPNYVYKLFSVSADDPQLPLQYGHSVCLIQEAWTITTGTGLPRVNVAVLDTGVNYNHEDLGAGFGPSFKVYGGADFIQNDGNPVDDDNHGSAVTGIIAADVNNATGMSGVSNGARILAVKVCTNGTGGCPTDAIANGIRYATVQGVHIINLSLGGPSISETIRDAVANAIAARITVIAAAGNAGTSVPQYPAAYDGVIAVSASDAFNDFASFSSFGEHITLAAPGVSILSIQNGGSLNNAYGTTLDGTLDTSGTSFSAPYVAGVAALMLALQPNLTPAQVAKILAVSADDILDPGRDTKSGAGRLNAFNALSRTLIEPGLDAPPANVSVPMPNPFISSNPNAVVTFRIPDNFATTTVSSVKIYNAVGQPVRSLSGTNVWDGRNDNGKNVMSGIYFYEIQTPGGNSRNKVVVIR